MVDPPSTPHAPNFANGHRPTSLNDPGTFTFPPREPPRQSLSPMSSHRQSFSEQQRSHPSSPRSHRQPSLSQQAVQDLLNNPPLPHKADSEFVGRDWRSVEIGEVIDPEEVHWAERDTTVEEATNILVTAGAPNVVLIRDRKDSKQAVATFDYSDLNGYLLLVVGLAHPDPEYAASFEELSNKAQEGKPVSLRDIMDVDIGRREDLVMLPENAKLPDATKILASGIHRIIVVKEGTHEVVSVLTQLRLVRFFWEYGRHFASVEQLYGHTLTDLMIGSKAVRSINGDLQLSDALRLMDQESITSLPVLDNSNNVVGNISHVDVRLLTKNTSLPLLRSTCIHFISVILSERGMDQGRDSFPVFYVNPYSTLAHTVAKLVATRSHRMWIVDAPSPGTSQPATPAIPAVTPSQPLGSSLNPQLSGPPYTGAQGPAVSASALPGQNMSGKLSGVVSLTDVLNLFAKVSGLEPREPDEARRLRRRSSSSSVRTGEGSVGGSSVRSSVEVERRSGDVGRGSGTLPHR